ncbi:MAG TPA: radical SAM protein [Spirochaetia bacterium]|nr:radical SAM protein [Spirochaetia bacterium]
MYRLSETTCRTALNPSKIPGADWCLNPYRGCSHACVYCYAGCLAQKRGSGEKWGSFVEARTNFVERLAAQVRRPKRGTVLLSSVTDAYQVAEERYGLTARCLTVLGFSDLRVSILTKSDLVLRDLALLRSLPEAVVGFSITTVDDDLAVLLEPGAPPPSRRLAALRSLARAGIRTWVFVAPVIPGLNDAPEDLVKVSRAARAAGALEVEFDPFNFYPLAVSQVRELINRHLPGQSGAFEKACRDPAAFRRGVRQDLPAEIRNSL